MSSASSCCSCSGALWSLLQKRIELAEQINPKIDLAAQMMLLIPRIISSWHRIPLPYPQSESATYTSELHCVSIYVCGRGACVQSVFVALFCCYCYCMCTCVLSNLFDSYCYAPSMWLHAVTP